MNEAHEGHQAIQAMSCTSYLFDELSVFRVDARRGRRQPFVGRASNVHQVNSVQQQRQCHFDDVHVHT